MEEIKSHIDKFESGLHKFSQGYLNFGLIVEDDGIMCREWIPDVKDVYLYGDFSKSNVIPDVICNIIFSGLGFDYNRNMLVWACVHGPVLAYKGVG